MPVIPAAALEFADLPGRRSANPLPKKFDGGCSVRVVQIPPGARTPHRHPHSVEVVYVAAGSGTGWEDGVTAPVTAGDVVVLAAGVPHATIAGGDGLTLVCFFPVGDLNGNVEELDGPTVGG